VPPDAPIARVTGAKGIAPAPAVATRISVPASAAVRVIGVARSAVITVGMIE